jgi:hypothetical protein
MNLERVIYYESFRRKRHWDGPSAHSSADAVVSLNNLSSPYTTAYRHTLPEDVVGPSTGVSYAYDANVTQDDSENYHWASKYTGLAKAGRRAESFSDQASDVFKRLGLVDDPQLLWDLTPYSWLVDWFTTMGDSIANANTYAPHSGKYSVDYAYLTTKRVQSIESRIARSRFTAGFSYISIRTPFSYGYSTTKWRDRATPFGFGTQLGSLSASQFGILVALGLAQSR